ncbi:P2X purinoceptor 7-like [Trematomus bernacchii]|uniref:P2X purinoceptor 7-like n=1 Tax=Trematomus bernacchii TaxID=40690 RepID=UPI00146D18CB|nr:P2X purinoceptor 7-like [Trematomus bernacchii]
MLSQSNACVQAYYEFDPESDPEEAEVSVEVQTSRLQQDVSEWCTCANCAAMPSEPENVCCMEIPQVSRRMQELELSVPCMVDHPGLEPVCLNVFSLQNAFNIYRAEHGRLQMRQIQQRHRYLAYRSFVSWCWGFLGRKIRVVIPACVVLRIHREFPDPQNNYVGFRQSN